MLPYLGAIILGMDDALVELTGALAGFTMAFGECRLIALAGVTTGVAATLSMAASEFVSQDNSANGKKPWIAAAATGLTYLLTVALLLSPFFFFDNPFLALFVCFVIAAIIILVFSWGVSKIRKTSFSRSFRRMLIISFSVALAAFLISWQAGKLWGVPV